MYRKLWHFIHLFTLEIAWYANNMRKQYVWCILWDYPCMLLVVGDESIVVMQDQTVPIFSVIYCLYSFSYTQERCLVCLSQGHQHNYCVNFFYVSQRHPLLLTSDFSLICWLMLTKVSVTWFITGRLWLSEGVWWWRISIISFLADVIVNRC